MSDSTPANNRVPVKERGGHEYREMGVGKQDHLGKEKGDQMHLQSMRLGAPITADTQTGGFGI